MLSFFSKGRKKLFPISSSQIKVDMKIIDRRLRILVSVMTMPILLFISSCGGGSEPEPQQTAAELAATNLTNSAWKVTSVTIDGVDKSNMFTNLSIKFNASSNLNGQASLDGSFTATNGGVVWPASGSWNISSDGRSLTRGDGVAIQLTDITSTSLKMSLAWSQTTFGTGRSEGLKGQHEFSMGK